MSNSTHYFKKIYEQNRNFILYGTIGCITTVIDVGIFTLLNHFDAHELIDNTISYQVAMVFSFFLNRRFNFKVKDNMWKRFLSFFLVNLIGYGISQVLVLVFITLIELPKFPGKLLATILAGLAQFFVIKYWTFKPKN